MLDHRSRLSCLEHGVASAGFSFETIPTSFQVTYNQGQGNALPTTESARYIRQSWRGNHFDVTLALHGYRARLVNVTQPWTPA